MKYTLEEIVARMRNLYIAEDGLGRLEPYPLDSRPGKLESVNSENGILYRAFAMVKAVAAGYVITIVDRFEMFDVLNRLQRQPGLLNRWPGVDTVYEQHDNAVGALAIAELSGDQDLGRAMVKHWYKNKLCFDNVTTGRFSWHQFRQPGEVALYYVQGRLTPPLTFVLWMCMGLLIQALSKEQDAAQARLSWLRLWIIERSGPVKGPLSRLAINITKQIWFSRTKAKYGAMTALFSFGERHPVTQFQQLIDNAENK